MRENRQLRFDQPAPDIILRTITGEEIRLASLWQKQPLLLAFTRHFGCTQCKEMLEELVAGKEKITAAGLRLAIVLQDTPEASAIFAEKFAPGLFCLADPDRKAYQAYHLERGTLFQTFFNTRVWKAVANSRKKGYAVEPPPPGQDAMQMSGTFIISTSGRIELPFYYDHIADHPPLDLLIGGVLSSRWNQPFDGPVGPAGIKK